MSRYYARHLRRLASEADNRFHELIRTLDTHKANDDATVQVDGTRIRLAVDDFKAILAEIRRMK